MKKLLCLLLSVLLGLCPALAETANPVNNLADILLPVQFADFQRLLEQVVHHSHPQVELMWTEAVPNEWRLALGGVDTGVVCATNREGRLLGVSTAFSCPVDQLTSAVEAAFDSEVCQLLATLLTLMEVDVDQAMKVASSVLTLLRFQNTVGLELDDFYGLPVKLEFTFGEQVGTVFEIDLSGEAK